MTDGSRRSGTEGSAEETFVARRSEEDMRWSAALDMQGIHDPLRKAGQTQKDRG